MTSIVSRDSINGDSAAVLTAFYKLSNQLWFNSCHRLLNLPFDNMNTWFLVTVVVIRKLPQQSSDIFVICHIQNVKTSVTFI